ncbi:hypothetical protein BVRB_3g062950 [Beta vulgaris subsp. vulgaris]|nr:hypothetical protein BVRB_3g062950 [Beta vulgaris subsp. vulgaris]
MKFQATAAEFRDLVQGLTGRDAVFKWPDEQLYEVQQVNAEIEDCGVTINDDLILHEQVVHKEVDLSACFGPNDHLGGYDYFVDEHHLVVMEDLRAFIGADDDDLMVRGM